MLQKAAGASYLMSQKQIWWLAGNMENVLAVMKHVINLFILSEAELMIDGTRIRWSTTEYINGASCWMLKRAVSSYKWQITFVLSLSAPHPIFL